ncbi:ABC transporter ATP-binding protein [Lysinibacter sp. HNR]|uniref:ABC transporter ATP-binding protein n=1 Tax=Lysinibacter sp. HNR TaxID=3031408 RepID=UPI0024357C69|nr:ABC transporter ATP-binding protein [Lysinibacter sp. HNR]WGD37968.1 ABC transporter ATP-binding protein [Lysinibacter sp. HNR]
MNSQSTVEVSNLTKRYDKRSVLDGVGFEIRPAEIFGLLGPNGAGKSTTIEILEGYRSRDGGSVRVLDADPQTAGLEWRSRIGIVGQSSPDFGVFTVAEQVRYFSRFYPNARPVDEVLRLVGLEDRASVRINKLSGGQRRRVDVAIGIVGRPHLLFLDEPTTGFDPEARHQFWQLIRQLRDEGTTILLTTHYLDEAAELCDHLAVLTRGTIVHSGTVDTLGGEHSRIPLVRWKDASGNSHEQRTTEPTRLVHELAKQQVVGGMSAAEAMGEIPFLEIVRPSLEDVYLSLIGTEASTEKDTVPTTEKRTS